VIVLPAAVTVWGAPADLGAGSTHGVDPAALDVLLGPEGLAQLMRSGMTAARDRSRDLSKQ